MVVNIMRFLKNYQCQMINLEHNFVHKYIFDFFFKYIVKYICIYSLADCVFLNT